MFLSVDVINLTGRCCCASPQRRGVCSATSTARFCQGISRALPLSGFGNICDADFDGCLTADLGDFSRFRSVFGSLALGVMPWEDADHADCNEAGAVDLDDSSMRRAQLGGVPGPSWLSP